MKIYMGLVVSIMDDFEVYISHWISVLPQRTAKGEMTWNGLKIPGKSSLAFFKEF